VSSISEPPIFIWSSGRVLLISSSSGTTREAAGFSGLESLGGPQPSIVLIAHRASLVRQVSVPSLSKEQVRPLLESKLGALLPTGLNSYVCDFRLAKIAGATAKTAIVGAVKEESFRKMLSEAKVAGVKVGASLPSAFGSWLAAHARGLRDCVVVSREASDLCIDIIADGELKYSRFCAFPESPLGVLDEIERTCATAGVAMGSILNLGEVEMPLDTPGVELQPGGVAKFVNNLHAIQTQLFSLELPETIQLRERKKGWVVAQRAVFAAIVASGLWGYALFQRQKQEGRAHDVRVAQLARVQAENKNHKTLIDETLSLKRTERLIDIAFDPAQTFGDLVALLSQDSDDKSWVTGISLERGRPMTVRGQAKDGKTVTKLASKLSNEPRLRNVKLMSVGKGQEHNGSVVQFAISGVPIGNLPFDSEVTPEKPNLDTMGAGRATK
jgi:hypothetical protein